MCYFRLLWERFFVIYNQLCFSLQKYVKDKDYFLKAREIIMSKLLFSALPFRVWNHSFLCERSQYCIDICLYCTKLYISYKKISDHINKILCVPIEQFHASIMEGIVIAEKTFIFAHTNILLKKMIRLGEILVIYITRVLALRFFSGKCT